MSCGSTHFACDCMRARIAVLESALRRVLLYLESCGGEPHDPEVQAAQDIRQALQGEASKGGNADLLAAVRESWNLNRLLRSMVNSGEHFTPRSAEEFKRVSLLVATFLEPSPAEQEGDGK